MHIAINEGLNSSVVIADQGRILFALQEERVNRQKEYAGFPHEALKLALQQTGVAAKDVTHVCLSNLASPQWTRQNFLAAYERRRRTLWQDLKAGDAPALRERLAQCLPTSLLRARLQASAARSNQTVEANLQQHSLAHAKVVRHHHQHLHAASAYFGSRQNPVDPHLVLSLDGGGDGECARVYLAREGKLELLSATPQGHSIGNIYSCTTHIMGMTPHEHEYKLMGLAAYAKPAYFEQPLQAFRSYLDLDNADALQFRRRTPEPTTHLQLRLARDLRFVRFDNICGALQKFTEELLSRWVQAAIRRTGVRKIVAAGGVFMNVKANKLIAEMPGVEFFDVFPSCGDETLPFGSLWQLHAELHPDQQHQLGLEHFYLGPDAAFDWPDALRKHEAELRAQKVTLRPLQDPERDTALMLAEGKIVARCSGRMEFGARALGNRSILADPANLSVIATINRMIKSRDFWMPFAPAVLKERAADYLRLPATLPADRLSPHMMHTFDTTDRRAKMLAGVHAYDLTARAQTVAADRNPGFERVIQAFEQRTGRGVVLNTSFNLHGYPIVLGAADAIDVFLKSGLTHLVVNDQLLVKGAAVAEA